MPNSLRRFSFNSRRSSNGEGINSSDVNTQGPLEERAGFFTRLQAKFAGSRVSQDELKDAITKGLQPNQGLQHDRGSYEWTRGEYKVLRDAAKKTIQWIKESEQTLLVNGFSMDTILENDPNRQTLRQSIAFIDDKITCIQIGKNSLGYDDNSVLDEISEFKGTSEPFFEKMRDIYQKVYHCPPDYTPEELPTYVDNQDRN